MIGADLRDEIGGKPAQFMIPFAASSAASVTTRQACSAAIELPHACGRARRAARLLDLADGCRDDGAIVGNSYSGT